MVQAFPFGGFLNYDDPDEVIPSIHIRDALNIQWKGTAPNMRAENMPGNREKTNQFLTNDTNNLTVGRFYDAVNKRIFFFNYRGDNKKAIYMYDTVAAVFYRLAEESVNAAAGSLGITQNPIIHINIIYGDAEQGDILAYLDGNGVPRKINIKRALASGYGTIIAPYLDVAKEPADIPPSVSYENDPANIVNNCRKRLFRFKIRWVFDDKDKSVTSSQSEMPLPLNAFDQDTDADPTKNCRVAIIYQTGPINVKKVEILAANSLGVTMSDWYLVASLDKDSMGIPSSDVATFLFYNDRAYTFIDIEEGNQIFDYVPIAAGAQVLLNGSVLDYGSITEGYPNLLNFGDGIHISDITTSMVPFYHGNYYSNFVANQGGLSGFGSGVIHIVLRGLIISTLISLNTYTVYLLDGTSISYTVSDGDDAAAVIEGLRVDALAEGFTIVSVGNNDLYIAKTNSQLSRVEITSDNDFSFNRILYTSLKAYDWSSKYGFGLVYFDAKGRTNGAVFTDGFSVQTPAFIESDASTPYIPLLNASIFQLPPSWAYYYQWVRTKNLSKSNFVQWISDRTLKDAVALSGLIKYAYISIESLRTFVTNNPGSPLGYSYTPGDRIRFFKRYNEDGSTAILYGNTKDYEIIASPINPVINGQEILGQFIKIVLPTTDGNFDFGDGFANYFIEIYTPAQPVANNLNLYYEFGERYAIGNPGSSNRFHQGMNQNQVNFVQPATFSFFKGDDYIRLRAIQTGNVYSFNILQGGTGNNIDTILIGMNFNGSTYTVAGITPQSVPYVPLTGSFNPSGDSRHFLESTPATTFRVQGTITLTFTNASGGDSWHIYHINRSNESFDVVDPFNCPDAGTFTFAIDTSITLENDWMFLIAASTVHHARTVTFSSSNLTYTIDHVINQQCIDPNFADTYPSSVNSNGRAFVYDENANQVTYPVMHRWSLAYQTNTNINQTNRFYAKNFDEVVREFGAIKRMMFWDKTLTIFQERKCGQMGVYQRFISNSNGTQQLVTSADIITSNNVQYYTGNYGVGNQPDSVVQSGFVYYFTDPIKGEQCRLSRDGITPLSEIYKTKTWASANIIKYLTPYNYTYGGTSRITGTFNIRKDNVGEYLCVLQPGTLGDQTLTGQTMGFDEARNAFTSIYSFAPECIVCAENVLYSWRNGRLYIHDVTTGNGMNTFYGIYYDSSITRVFNAGLVEKKTFLSLTEVASAIWDCPTIYTNSMSYGTTPQQSNLIISDFANLESNFSASFWRDTQSIGGLTVGDSLKGNLIVIKFRASNAARLIHMTAVNLYFVDSPFTSR